MGRKTKIGKRRKDKFYHLAKETGYRARSAFKLAQLNRKYQFLQSSRVLIDLCAAPGGWLQVASKSMPISSVIVGVDLMPIKPIPNVITIQEDITSERCKQLLQKELNKWKADCVLNDGAPNVGSAWVQDAFSQAELTLAALKLACAFLQEGGWFITKVFRSKDYQPLMWVLEQLFKKVHATKPQASRIESAEIFVVCQGYLAPSSIDEKMLNPKHVFQEVEEEKAAEKISLTKLQKPAKSAEGYPEDVNVLFKSTPVSEFIMGDNHLAILRDSNQLTFDRTSGVFAHHPLTTDEVRENCHDLRVLGPRELKQLVKWREKMRKFLEEVGSEGEGEEENGEVEDTKEEDEDLEGIDVKVKALRARERAEVKRELRYLRKQRKKLKERLVVRGGTAEETGELIRQEHLFQLRTIKTQAQLKEVEEGEEECGLEGEGLEGRSLEGGDESDCEEVLTDSNAEDKDDVSEGEEFSDGDLESCDGEAERESAIIIDPKEASDSNPLLVGLESADSAAGVVQSNKAKLWFNKPIFKELEEELEDLDDEEMELEQMVRSYERKGGHLWTKEDSQRSKGQSSNDTETESDFAQGTKNKRRKQLNEKSAKVTFAQEAGSEKRKQCDGGVGSDGRSDDDSETSSSDEDDTFSTDAEDAPTRGQSQREKHEKESAAMSKKKRKQLDPEGLAMGAVMVQSKKKHEELIESGYNRWTSNDTNLPDWFAEDEAKFCQKRLPISREMVEVYRSKLKEMNARPIKKVAEAKARKKRRAVRNVEKVRKKAESISGGVDVSVEEKAQQMRQLYKKAGVLGGKKSKGVEYVVAKRGVGKRVRRPAGVKGHFKVVDPRMKKDKRGQAARDKRRTRRRK